MQNRVPLFCRQVRPPSCSFKPGQCAGRLSARGRPNGSAGPAVAHPSGHRQQPHGSSSSHTARSSATKAGTAAAAAAAAAVARVNPAARSATHQALIVVGALLHLVLAYHQWHSDRAGRLQAVLLALATLALAATNLVFAAFCMRHRTAVLTFCRLALFASPAWRKTLPPLLLGRAAQPGWLGALRDTVHVITGTRLLLVAVGGAAVPLPPAATVAVQLLLLHLSSPAQVCCAAQLLVDKVTKQRMAGLAAAVDCVTLPAQLLVALADNSFLPGPTSRPQPAAVCTAVLLFMQLSLGLLLPALLAAHTWRPAAANGSPDILAMPRVAHLQHLAAPHIAFLRTLHNSIASGVSKSATAADATVHALLSSNRVRIAVAAYWVYSLCWVFCKRLAGIYATC